MYRNLVNLVELTRVVELLDQRAQRRIVDKALDAAGIDRAILDGSTGFVPYAAEAVLIETVARETGDRHLGAWLGREFNHTTYDAYSVYVMSAPDLAAALDRGRRALLYVHPGSEIVIRRTATHLVVGRDSAGLSVVGHRHLDEGAIFVIADVATHFLGANWKPDWVELPNVRESELAELEGLFGTSVRTDREIPSIAIRLSDLSAPNPGLPESDMSLTLGELSKLMGVAPAQTTVQAVQQVLDMSFKSGVADERTVARFLAISSRTLQRALRAEGVSFRKIRAAAVTKRAKSLLSQPDNAISDISTKLGYTDPSAFRRAFKKATGMSASEFRGHKKGS